MIRQFLTATLLTAVASAFAAPKFVSFTQGEGSFKVISDGKVAPIYVDKDVNSAGQIAAASLAKDIKAVSNVEPTLLKNQPSSGAIIIGTVGTPAIDKYISSKKIDGKQLKGKNEKYILKVIDGNLVIAGSDRRGTVYGIYELSEQLGVSPW
jgi:alpha-glucuronidase